MTASRTATRTPTQWARRGAAAAALVLTALLLAGCTGSGGVTTLESSDSGAARSPGLTAPEQADEQGDVQGDVQGGMLSDVQGATGDMQGTTADVQSSTRDVITTGSVSITVTDPIAAAQDAVDLIEQAGGRVDSRNENPGTDTQPASANLSLRIPSDALDRTLTELKSFGVVNFVSLTASDVTAQSQDLDARITSLQTSVDRLLGLLSEATDTTDLIAIESALSTRQAELESLQSQRAALSDQIDYSTLSLELYSEGVVAPASPDNFFTGLLTGWNALVAALGGLLVGLGVALPWLILIGAVAGIALLIVRRSRNRHKAN